MVRVALALLLAAGMSNLAWAQCCGGATCVTPMMTSEVVMPTNDCACGANEACSECIRNAKGACSLVSTTSISRHTANPGVVKAPTIAVRRYQYSERVYTGWRRPLLFRPFGGRCFGGRCCR
jgi:hypothetical protein